MAMDFTETGIRGSSGFSIGRYVSKMDYRKEFWTCVWILEARGPFLERPSNLPSPISNFGDKCLLQKSIFVSFEY